MKRCLAGINRLAASPRISDLGEPSPAWISAAFAAVSVHLQLLGALTSRDGFSPPCVVPSEPSQVCPV
ncbi:hypothetical protein THTE_0423 [Thermogutta terrifontis]|uniref:Uncharacterized protein n=1 Tax=Thermogutta terrifontis TaxID=1331910 RepID=A0A286RAN0_9BACT|nr:hypothetical protein THTE_0423 [Thermogutta terrifontis]